MVSAGTMMDTEQEIGGKAGFFSKIKRGFASMSLEIGLGEVEPKKGEEVLVAVPAPIANSPATPPTSVAQAPSQEKIAEEAQEIVITCEGAAGPQVRRDRGHGPTITHSTSPKAQSKWLFAEVEAKAVAPAEAKAPEILTTPPTPQTEAVSLDTPKKETPDTTRSTVEPRKIAMANNLKESLNELMQIDGATGVALVDSNSGMAMGTAGNGPLNLEVAAAGNSEVVRSKLKVMKALNLRENIEDILITLGSQYHLIRPLAQAPDVFIYLVLNKANSNLAMARFKLASVEKELSI